jgi:signal transduction histidine kinase
MTRSLAFKLVLAFLLVSIAGAALTALFARWATFRDFDRLVLEQATDSFSARTSTYYQINGSWEGVREFFRGLGALPPAPSQSGVRTGDSQPPPMPPELRVPYVFALADREGQIVLPAGPYRLGSLVPADELVDGIEIEVDGQVVGTALVTGNPPPLAPQEQRYLARTDRSSLYAALAATLVALVLGIFLARTLTRPVRELTAATQSVAKGPLGQQVPVRSQDELGDLAAAFNQMSADLARANELRRQMTADIAHDLRSPLSVMAGYLEALRDGVLQPSAARFETMYQEAQHLQHLVEDLRTLSLADAGELALNLESVPPQRVLAQAAAAHRHQADQQQVDLSIVTDPSLPTIHIDRYRMAQVLGNLITNALRHTGAGDSIVLSATQERSHVVLSVRDTGTGIAPDKLPRIFDRFYRQDEARQAHEGESGLGLAIAKSLIDLHGGAISVESTVGEGTTFSIHIG